MSRREREKGRRGELEVAHLYADRGLEVRGLEGSGDHIVVCGRSSGLTLHSETKRQETARVWEWWKQASDETEAGAMTVLHFRRSRSRWLALVDAEAFAELVVKLDQVCADLANMAAIAEEFPPAGSHDVAPAC